MSDVYGDAPLDFFGADFEDEPGFESPGENYSFLGYVPLDEGEKYVAGLWVDLGIPDDPFTNNDAEEIITAIGVSFLQGLEGFEGALGMLAVDKDTGDYDPSDFRGAFSSLGDAYDYVAGTWLESHSEIVVEDGLFYVYANESSE